MAEADIADIVARLKTIIADQLDVNLVADEIDERDSFFEGGMGIDSIAIVELIAITEQHFGIEFADEDLVPEWFRSLRVFAELVVAKRTQGPSTAASRDA
jgi:acyl carrier protein